MNKKYNHLVKTKHFGIGVKNSGIFAFGIVGCWDERLKEISFTLFKFDIYVQFHNSKWGK